MVKVEENYHSFPSTQSGPLTHHDDGDRGDDADFNSDNDEKCRTASHPTFSTTQLPDSNGDDNNYEEYYPQVGGDKSHNTTTTTTNNNNNIAPTTTTMTTNIENKMADGNIDNKGDDDESPMVVNTHCCDNKEEEEEEGRLRVSGYTYYTVLSLNHHHTHIPTLCCIRSTSDHDSDNGDINDDDDTSTSTSSICDDGDDDGDHNVCSEMGKMRKRGMKKERRRGRGRTGINLIAVIDKSGSMRGEKMETMKATLLFILSKLTEIDQFGMIEYDSHTSLSIPLTTMTSTSKLHAISQVEAIKSGSSTNLCDGMIEALRMLSSLTYQSNTPSPYRSSSSRSIGGGVGGIGGGGGGVVNSILLMTDGQANEGITSIKGILEKMQIEVRDINVKRLKYTIHTFGYGDGHDTHLLKEIAHQHEGSYYYIKSHADIATSFGDCLGGLLSVIAQSVELTISSLPLFPLLSGITSTSTSTISGDGGEQSYDDDHHHRISKINTIYTVREVIPHHLYRIQLGNLQAGEERDIMIEVDLPAIPPPPPPPSSSSHTLEGDNNIIGGGGGGGGGHVFPVISLYLSYYDCIEEKMREDDNKITILRSEEAEITSAPKNSLVDRHCNRLLVTSTLNHLNSLLTSSSSSTSDHRHQQRQSAIHQLQQTITTIQQSISADHEMCRLLIEELNQMINKLQQQQQQQQRRGGNDDDDNDDDDGGGNDDEYERSKWRSMSQSLMSQRSVGGNTKLFDTPLKAKMRFDSADFSLKKLSRSVSSLPPLPPLNDDDDDGGGSGDNNSSGSINGGGGIGGGIGCLKSLPQSISSLYIPNLSSSNNNNAGGSGSSPQRSSAYLRLKRSSKKIRFDSCDFEMRRKEQQQQQQQQQQQLQLPRPTPPPDEFQFLP